MVLKLSKKVHFLKFCTVKTTSIYAAIGIKLQKENNFWQFKRHTSRKSHANWTSDPIFFVYFFSSICLWNYFLYMKIDKFIFMCRPRSPFWSVKYLNFRQKLKTLWGYWKFILCFVPRMEPKKIYQLMA